MSTAEKNARQKHLLAAFRSYVSFFMLMAFIITCCLMLFITQLTAASDIALDRETLRPAAVWTFFNVILLSILCTVIDAVRRRFMIHRPVKRIVETTEKIMNGDLSARVSPPSLIESTESFDIIIRYINRMAEELSGLETLRTDFIANVSHELKTPLAVIQNYGTLLQVPDLTEEKRLEYAKAITSSTRRLTDLITNILRLNRLENQRIYPDKQTYNLGEQLAECLLNFEDTWTKKEIKIDTDIEEEVFVESDAELLTLVWNNLFSNAMKFTKQGGTVGLSLKTEGGFAVVQVNDTGCGISPETGKHIFEKFYQGDTSHAAQGNGLGLALVKRVVDIVGGDISVSSEVGKGSTFTVKIRRKRDGEIQAGP